jgi:hypothetical protein
MKSQNENSATDQKKKQKNKRYAFAQRQGEDFSCSKITGRRLRRRHLQIQRYQVASEPEAITIQGEIPLRFTYDIMVNPNKGRCRVYMTFRNYIGDILIEIVEEQLKEGKVEFNG